MGVSAASAIRATPVRSGSFAAGGVAAWLCGMVAIGVAAWMFVVAARAGWAEIATGMPHAAAVLPSLAWSFALVGVALALAVIVAFGGAVAAAEPAIGGRPGRLLNRTLQASPAVPSIAIGVAALAIVAADARVTAAAAAHPLVAAAIALAALNVPIMTARLRTVFLAVPRVWRIAAAASGATPGGEFARLVLPRTWRGVLAVLLNGAGQMLGETVVVAIILNAAGGGAIAPLSVISWERLARGAAASDPTTTAVVLVLVACVAALRLAARALFRRPRRAGANA